MFLNGNLALAYQSNSTSSVDKDANATTDLDVINACLYSQVTGVLNLQIALQATLKNNM